MKRVFLTILLALAIWSTASAQRTMTLYPTQNPSGLNWTSIDASSSTSQTFYFMPTSGVSSRNGYSGYCEVVVEIDSADGTVGDRDGFTASVRPLMAIKTSRDAVAFRESGHVDGDSIDVVNAYNWGTTDDDTKYDLNVSTNVPPCDGVKVYIYTGADGQCKFRVSLRIAYMDGF